ncbi:hypothetical protein AVEN_129172-1 [Araneus ventricosus]|uniref:Uncharacterized protein n=1 Tax=Araneus ventricosus TaxID=182803 RepID=A0A4Y2SBC0_ARAVE|nr:hypothetical protein AVEN_20832-1 [Araneus ventricosus]GBN84622.1 hypothetical protein AVEN_129172-1 [Araneus ventricosus]
MDEDKAFCVNCSQEVDINTHMNCTLTFDDLLALEERDDTGNYLQNEVESAAQRQQENNSSELRRENQDNNSGKRKQDFDTETSLQTPTKVVTSKRNSTSPRILGDHNPEVQQPQNTEYGNSISRHKDDFGSHYYPPEAPYTENFARANLLANPAFSHPIYSNHWTEQKTFGNIRQQQYEFQSAIPQSSERNKLHQENPQLICGQTFATNALQPGYIPDLRPAFPIPFPQAGIDAFGYMENNPHINYPMLQNRYVPYSPYPGMAVMNPDSNTRVENYPESLTKLPSSSEHTVDLNYAARNKITVNKEMDLLGQNKRPSKDLISKSEMEDESRSKFSTSPHLHFLKTDTQCTQHKNAERSTLQKQEEKSAQKKHAENSAKNKHAEKSAKKHSEKSAKKKHAEKSAQEKDTKLENTAKSAQQKNAEKSAQQENASYKMRRDRDGVRTLELHRSYVLRKVALRRTGNSSEKVRSLAVARREEGYCFKIWYSSKQLINYNKKNRDKIQNYDSSNSCSKRLKACIYKGVDEAVLKWTV